MFEFRVLGPLEVRLGGAVIPIPAAKQRTLLAALLVDANRTVSTDELIRRLWDGDAPDRARAILHSYVMRLRRVLGASGAAVPVATRPEGYTLEAAEDSLDLLRFRRLLREAESALNAADPASRVAVLGAALDLWHGDPLPDVPSRLLHQQVVPVWTEQRLVALEQRVDAELALGREAGLLAELRDLTVRHPLRERFWEQRMLALYRSGRTADALACFREVGARLAGELGIDPGPALSALHQAVLTNDASLTLDAAGGRRTSGVATLAPAADDTAATAESATSAAGRVRRNDLPADIADFAGRDAELSELTRLLREGTAHGTAVLVSAIDGMGGIGKTTLAVHAAHRSADAYPDAQLFLDLHGHSQTREPLNPQAALETLLRAVGVPTPEIPDDPDERAARWRAELIGRRILLILDNAATTAQVRPLLPGAPGCLVLITSRRRLVDLETTGTLSLDVLPEQDALTLFSRIAGAARVGAEPGASAEVLRLCGYLPLAVRIAAARLRSRAGWSVAHLAERLRDTGRRLAELDTGERGVATTFALSYELVDEPGKRMFRLLGLLPGPTFDTYAAAALTGTGTREAEAVLENLADAHLLEPVSPGRYRLHDLMRDHAGAVAERTETVEARREALVRAFDYYVLTGYRANEVLYPGKHLSPLALDYPPLESPELPDYAHGLAWFDAEHANLSAATAYDADPALDRLRCGIAALAWQYFRQLDFRDAWFALLHDALRAAERSGDAKARADGMRHLGVACWECGRYPEAIRYYREALDHYLRTGDLRGEAQCSSNIGMIRYRFGEYESALEYQKWGLEAYTALEDPWGQGSVQINIALVYSELGRHREALEHNLSALALFEQVGDEGSQAGTLSNIGMNYRDLGRFEEAERHHRQALGMAADLGIRRYELEFHNDFADTLIAAGEHAAAARHYREALTLAADFQDPFDQARAHEGLALTLARTDPRAAADHGRRAAELYQQLSVPRAAQLREKLEALQKLTRAEDGS